MKLIMEIWRQFLSEQTGECGEGEEYDHLADECYATVGAFADDEDEDEDDDPGIDISKIKKTPRKKKRKKRRTSSKETTEDYPTFNGGEYLVEPIEGFFKVGSTFGKGSQSRLDIRAGMGSEDHGAIDQFKPIGTPVRVSTSGGKVVWRYSAAKFDRASAALGRYLATREDFIYRGDQIDPKNKVLKVQRKLFGKSMKDMSLTDRKKLKSKPNLFFRSGRSSLSKAEKSKLNGVKNWLDLRSACQEIFRPNMIAQLLRVKRSIKSSTGFKLTGPYFTIEYTSDQGDKYWLRYMHLSEISNPVLGNPNDIAKIGHGACFDSKPHLHLDIRKNGIRVDPQKMIPNLDPNKKTNKGVVKSGKPGKKIKVPKK